MEILKKIFGLDRDPMLVNFQQAVETKHIEVFYGFGFEYTEQNYLRFKKFLEENNLEKAKMDLGFNVNEYNLELYFASNHNL